MWTKKPKNLKALNAMNSKQEYSYLFVSPTESWFETTVRNISVNIFVQKLIELLLNIDFKSITFVVELWNAVATSFIIQFRFSPIFYACTLQKSAQFRNINKMLKIKYPASFLKLEKLSKWKVKIGKYPFKFSNLCEAFYERSEDLPEGPKLMPNGPKK